MAIVFTAISRRLCRQLRPHCCLFVEVMLLARCSSDSCSFPVLWLRLGLRAVFQQLARSAERSSKLRLSECKTQVGRADPLTKEAAVDRISRTIQVSSLSAWAFEAWECRCGQPGRSVSWDAVVR